MRQDIHVLRISILFIVSFFFLKSSCLAHKVNIFAYVEGNEVFTESYFNDGRKCQGAQIQVFDSNNKKLIEGNANKNGEFSFTPPVKTTLRIVLNASMGHRAEFIMRAEELEDLTIDEIVQKNSHEQETSHDKGAEIVQTDTEMIGMSREEIKIIVEEALDKKLAPIIRTLAKEKTDHGISIHDIMSGVGYILGLFGVAFLFRPKKEN